MVLRSLRDAGIGSIAAIGILRCERLPAVAAVTKAGYPAPPRCSDRSPFPEPPMSPKSPIAPADFIHTGYALHDHILTVTLNRPQRRNASSTTSGARSNTRARSRRS